MKTNVKYNRKMQKLNSIITSLIIITLLIPGCSPKPRFHDNAYVNEKASKKDVEMADNFTEGYTWTAYASFYGPKFNGRKTASGETFNMNGLTAAHRMMPFNTILEVVNLKNGKRVRVRVNDRGPFIKGRDLDLSLGAAKEIGMVEDGVIQVKITIISLGKD